MIIQGTVTLYSSLYTCIVIIYPYIIYSYRYVTLLREQYILSSKILRYKVVTKSLYSGGNYIYIPYVVTVREIYGM